MNHENALAEQIRQFGLEQEMENKRLEEQMRQFGLEQEMEKLRLEQQKELAYAQLREEQRQFDEQMALKQGGGYTFTKDSGSGGGGGGSNGGNGNVVNTGKTPAVSTEYYQGELNGDAKKYGTFSNGYQPKGISGHGTLSKTGATIEVETTKQYGANKGQNTTVQQNVWKAQDGTLWYWQGLENKYIKITQPSRNGGGRSKYTLASTN
jgi:hypothetical protein